MGPSDSAPDAAPALLADTLRLKERLSKPRWDAVVARAHERLAILRAVAAARAAQEVGGEPGVLAALFPEVPWTSYVGWKRRERQRRGGEAWERQLDERAPPAPYHVSTQLRDAVSLLRRVKPDMTCAEAKGHLEKQLGKEGKVSDSTLHRIWKAAGQGLRPGAPAGSRTKVERLSCGGGLALLAAAAADTAVGGEMATAVLAIAALVGATKSSGEAPVARGDASEETTSGREERACDTADASEAATDAIGVVEPETPAGAADGRDDCGRFTAAYNRAVHGSGGVDPRWQPDAEKRKRRDLTTLSLVKSSQATVAQKLLAIGLVPLLTERRGFDGLDGPSGGWLRAMGGTPYKAATLDRVMAELALLDVGRALWTTHAQQWARITKPWSEGSEHRWVRWACYVDATQDPYWTRHFASSGKVSRIGRVMPSLTRVALMGGPGVPLWVETHAGTVSLKKALLPMLDRFEAAVGKGELGRLTIVDNEMATVPLLMALDAREGKWFITVLKGALAKGAKRTAEGPWQRYREHDRIREVALIVHGKEAPEGGLPLRVVEMVREASRNPTSTLFTTDASPEELSTEEVPTAYLSRWPHQERRFRDGRNGMGLERSHGYSGAAVTHVALATAQEKSQGRVKRAEQAVTAAQGRTERARALLAGVTKEHRAAATEQVARAVADVGHAEKALLAVQQDAQHLSTTPREIYVRDTTRDGIATCLKMAALMLIEYVLKEYFGDLRMEVRTFIEAFVWLPVTMRETPTTRTYEIEASERSPEDTKRLRVACAEATRRKLVADGRRLRFNVRDPGDAPPA